jgi:uncharacterized protein HemX
MRWLLLVAIGLGAGLVSWLHFFKLSRLAKKRRSKDESNFIG